VLYIGLLLGLVPVQTTVLHYASVGGVRPDLCLLASVLIGFFAGEVEGGLMGLALGFVQDLFSADELWLNMISKGLIGLLAGFMGRHLAHATPAAFFGIILGISATAGVFSLLTGWQEGDLTGIWQLTETVLFPQALYDAIVGALVYWVLLRRGFLDQDFVVGRFPYG
jgi:uncharacterized membrane protein